MRLCMSILHAPRHRCLKRDRLLSNADARAVPNTDADNGVSADIHAHAHAPARALLPCSR
jgi:hypothetical protein